MANYKTGVLITGDASGAVKSLKLTRGQLDNLNLSKKKGIAVSKEYGNQLGKMSRRMKTLVPVAAVAGIGAIVTRTLSAADSVQKMSIRIGASTEALSEYKHVADLTGVQFDALSIGWQRQTRRIAEAAKGTGEARNALKELGLEAKTLVSQRPEEQFEAIAKAMEGVDSQADKVRLGMKLWDSEGVKLLQTIDGGAASLAAMRQEARDLGLSLSRDQVDAAAEAKDAITTLSGSAKGFTQQLVIGLAPALSTVLSNLSEIAKSDSVFDSLRLKLSDLLTEMYGKKIPSALDMSAKKVTELADEVFKLRDVLGELEAAGKSGSVEYVAYSHKLKFIKEQVAIARKSFETLSKSLGETEDSTEKSTDAIKENTDATGTNTGSKKEQRDTLEELIFSIDKEAKATHEFMGTMDRLHAEVMDGNLSFERYNQLVNMVATGQANAEQSTLSLANATAAASVEVDVFADAWQQAGNRIDAAFATMWKDGIDGFKDFKDSLLDSFKTMLSEMAHQALTRPILVRMGMVGGGMSASANARASLVSSFSGSDMAGAAGSIGSMFFGGGTAPNALGAGWLDSAGSGFSMTSNTTGWAGTAVAGALGGLAGSALYDGEHAGTGASAGAMIGMQVYGPIGAAIGAVLGGFVGDRMSTKTEATYINDADGVLPVSLDGLGRPTSHQGFEDGISSGGSFGHLGLADQGTSGLKAEQLQGALDSITALDNLIANAFGPEATSRVSAALDGWTAQDRKADDFMSNMFNRFQIIVDELDFRFADIAKLGADNLEEIATRLLAFKDIENYIDSDLLADQALLLAEAQKTLRDRFEESVGTTYRLAQAYDGSTEATTQLSSALQGRYQLELQYLNQISAVQQGLNDTIQGSIESIRLSVMDTAQQYDYFSNQAEALASSLANMVDPTEINQVVQEINSLTNQAYGLLGGDQKADVSGEFVDFLEGVLDQATGQLDAERDRAATESEYLRNAMVEAMAVGSERMAQRLEAAAAQQQQAADTLAGGASTFAQNLPVRVDVNFTGMHFGEVGEVGG